MPLCALCAHTLRPHTYPEDTAATEDLWLGGAEPLAAVADDDSCTGVTPGRDAPGLRYSCAAVGRGTPTDARLETADVRRARAALRSRGARGGREESRRVSGKGGGEKTAGGRRAERCGARHAYAGGNGASVSTSTLLLTSSRACRLASSFRRCRAADKQRMCVCVCEGGRGEQAQARHKEVSATAFIFGNPAAQKGRGRVGVFN